MKKRDVCLLLESSLPIGPLEVVVRQYGRAFDTLSAKELLTEKQHCPECIHHAYRANIWKALQLLSEDQEASPARDCDEHTHLTVPSTERVCDEIEEWLSLLESPSADERILAMQALHVRRHATLYRLLDDLRSADEQVVLRAITVIDLVGCHDSTPVAAYIELLEQRRLTAPVLRALGVVGRAAEPALTMIKRCLLDSDPEVQKESLWAYSQISVWGNCY